MKISETTIVIIIGLIIILIPFIRKDLAIGQEDLINISGTLKTEPRYHNPAKGGSYGKLELKEYSSREFYFYISSYSAKSLNKSNFFKEAKAGDKIKLTISREEYQDKLMNPEYPTRWQFINVYVSVYGIATNDKVYSSFRDFNLAFEQDGKLGYFLSVAGVAFIVLYLLWKQWREAKTR